MCENISGFDVLDAITFLGAIHMPVLGAVRAMEVEVVCSQCMALLLRADVMSKSLFEFSVCRAAGREDTFFMGEPMIWAKVSGELVSTELLGFHRPVFLTSRTAVVGVQV